MVRVTKLELHRSISDIMKKGNLDQLTTKKIRLLCEQKYKVDLTSRKQEIDKIVMAFVRKKSGTNEKADKDSNESSNDESSSYESDECGSSCSSKSGSTRCYSADIQECSYSESSEEEPTPKKDNVSGSSSRSGSQRCHSADNDCSYSESSEKEPIPKNKVNKVKTMPLKPVSPKKVVKASTTPLSKKGKVYTSHSQAKKAKVDSAKQAELDDAAYARKLQAEEWSFRQRTVRNLFRDTPKRKNDDEELPRKKKAGAFMRKCLLSPALAEVIGTNEMSRPDVVQKMWAIVRERKLFDESNKQYALCDEQLTKVFGKKRVRLIGMMKHLKKHIKDIH